MNEIFYKDKNGDICKVKLLHLHANDKESVKMYYLDNISKEEVKRIADDMYRRNDSDKNFQIKIQFAEYG